VNDWTLHDLRRTFATNLAALDAAPHVVERLLNHASGTISGVAAIYNRFQYAAQMRDAIEMWEKHLKKLLA
jgi:integrase